MYFAQCTSDHPPTTLGSYSEKMSVSDLACDEGAEMEASLDLLLFLFFEAISSREGTRYLSIVDIDIPRSI